ncbi:hypothetical protein BJ508DRAFT_418872 [Ascobolus immersus RN42]|uniref:Uncharacterized protein n=1 Tax=Ascobolus immersus RN42 TaxID=1160509 RepID=A0A3N4HMZ6_ASCIM|nr:hypothetical protein BJ508DRAFT_418872 [Ascobolus immersus RN42]
MRSHGIEGIQHLEQFVTSLEPGETKDYFVRCLRKAKTANRGYKDEIFSPDVPDAENPLTDEERRISLIQARDFSDERDAVNGKGVIAAYESGELRINDKPQEWGDWYCLFWGGKKMTGWVRLEDPELRYSEKVEQWRKEDPNGRLWFESGLLHPTWR